MKLLFSLYCRNLNLSLHQRRSLCSISVGLRRAHFLITRVLSIQYFPLFVFVASPLGFSEQIISTLLFVVFFSSWWYIANKLAVGEEEWMKKTLRPRSFLAFCLLSGRRVLSHCVFSDCYLKWLTSTPAVLATLLWWRPASSTLHPNWTDCASPTSGCTFAILPQCSLLSLPNDSVCVGQTCASYSPDADRSVLPCTLANLNFQLLILSFANSHQLRHLLVICWSQMKSTWNTQLFLSGFHITIVHNFFISI